jgi:hypothetical protein
MPTIVYLIHGIGCGTSDGSPRAQGDSWKDGTCAAIQWIADTFKVARPIVLDPIPALPPAGSEKPDAIWIVPISYYSVFDEFRAAARTREDAVKGIAPALLVDAQITAISGNDFAWVNCLDVLLWWADTAQTRTRSTATILNAITQADLLARSIPGAKVRRILISHSLGTAAATAAVRHLGANNPVWPSSGGFQFWYTLANVAPFLIETEDVYSPPLLPGRAGTMVQRMYNVRHEADPIPWLLPWRHWEPGHAQAPWTADWTTQKDLGHFRFFETQGVLGLPGGNPPEITDVHGFTNYLLAPDIAMRLAAAMRGAAFSQPELDALDLTTARNKLAALSCVKNSTALQKLKQTTDAYIGELPVPPIGVPTSGGWLNRLLRAADILVDARSGC